MQVNALLSQIRDSERDADVVIVALETLAKIAWNDDEVSWASSLSVCTLALHCSGIFLAFLHSFPMLGGGSAHWRTILCAAVQVRAQVGEHDGVTIIVRAMKHWGDSGGVQCNGCLAIVSLVRAESEVCQVCTSTLCAVSSAAPLGPAVCALCMEPGC